MKWTPLAFDSDGLSEPLSPCRAALASSFVKVPSVLPAQNGVAPTPIGNMPFMCYKVQSVAKLSGGDPTRLPPLLVSMEQAGGSMQPPEAPMQQYAAASPYPNAAMLQTAPSMLSPNAEACNPAQAALLARVLSVACGRTCHSETHSMLAPRRHCDVHGKSRTFDRDELSAGGHRRFL
eukprot:TRINITY_DN104023_c0_g1_i1.p1 TRINITY_DN104023_c0_g1~~TRINITY_DN104023_c0_g1_i1.p1  ORF type:complete len:178 (+),score=27.70 TRINITY_DN104023_c0_g1_i1:261-794(+)